MSAGTQAAVNWMANSKKLEHIFEAIGRTPLVRLRNVTKDVNVPIYAKIEYFSPTGSLKDRAYFNMFRRALERGDLKPGMEILECSTGNAGIACSWASAVHGYKCTIVMPEGMSDERKKLMRAYGSELIFTAGGESDVDLALEKLAEVRDANPGKYFVPAQFENKFNPEAHYLTTGPEIWDQMEGEVGAYVTTQGTGGLFSGTGRFLRDQDPNVKLYAGEPAECPLLSKREWGPHKIEGIGDGFVPRNLDVSILSGVVTISSDEAMAMARELPRQEGVFCGISAAANVVAAIKLAKQDPSLKNIVTVICDTGQRYFSTELFGEVKHLEIPERDHPMDAYTKDELDKYQDSWNIVH